MNLQEYLFFRKQCNAILKEPEIRFVGFLNSMGNLIAGGFKEGTKPLNDESERRKLHIDSVLRLRTQEDFDYDLGSTEYIASRRKKVIIFTFQMDDNVLFVSTQTNVEIDRTAKKIIQICSI